MNNTLKLIVLGVFVAQCLYFATCLNAQEYSNESQVVIAVVAPRTDNQGDEIDYSVSINNVTAVTPLSIYFVLKKNLGVNQENCLAILFHKDIPIGILSELISSATKARYNANNIYVFIRNSEKWMMPVPGYKVIRFTTDSKELSKYLVQSNRYKNNLME